MSRPQSWAEVEQRLARICGDVPTAQEWLREALYASWGATDVYALPRPRRTLALQRAAGVVLRLEDVPYDLAFDPEVRAVFVRAFARHFGGVALHGPPWRVANGETDLPLHSEWEAALMFE